MKEKRFGALSSSADPEQLANTVRGAILAVAAIIVYIGTNLLGIEITQGDITSFAAAAGAIAGGVWTCYGIIQKFVVMIAKRS
jgi:hypothetical protein